MLSYVIYCIMLHAFLLRILSRLPFLAVLSETLLIGCTRLKAVEWTPASTPGGELAVVAGLPLASTNGTPERIGTAEGILFRDRIGPLLGLMAVQPRLLMVRRSQRFRATVAAIGAEPRARLAAMATAAGVDGATLLEANALVDAQCSAVVALPAVNRPLRVARNMDFFPAKVLGPGTVVEIVRQDGKRPYASVGWPGSASVISGMNDAGLVACILLNHRGPDLAGGEPVCLRLAGILQHDATVEDAVKRFAASPVGSSHYLLLADASTTTIVWQEPDGLHRDDPVGGWLSATNGPRVAGQPSDDRGLCLRGLCTGEPDEARLRQLMTASYMPGINAQAMLFEPATLTLDLAVGTGTHPAACQPWKRVALGPLLAGAAPGTATVVELPAPEPLKHYTE